MTMIANTPADALFRIMEDLEEADETADLAEEMKPGAIVRRPTADEPMGAVISEVSGPGWVWLYNTMTGEPVKVNRWHLSAALKKVHTDPSHPEYLGQKLFSARKIKEYVLGQLKCYLHPEHENAALFRSWGLKTCLSAHLPSPFEVTRHMEKRHKSEWAAIKGHQEEVRRQEDRHDQQEILRVLSQRAVLDAPTAHVDACEHCGEEISAGGTLALSNKMKAHLRKAHPEQVAATA